MRSSYNLYRTEAAELQTLPLRQWNLIGSMRRGVAASALAPGKRGFISFLALSAAVIAYAQNQPPRVTNAQFQTRPYTGNLQNELSGQGPEWFGYGIKSISKDNENCCWNGNGGGCWLERENRSEVHGASIHSDQPVLLEGSDELVVLFRVDNNQVEKIRAFSQGCPLDAGGLPFVWLNSVPARDSIRFLETFVSNSSDKLADGAIFAIAQHDDAQADEALERIARPPQSVHIREKAIFWMGASRGARGVTNLKQILAGDSDDKVREKAIFALSISKQPEAIDFMIHTAHSDPSPHVRGQALFWLGQKAGKKASQSIEDAIQNDPNTEVKKKAVFALSQLPKDDSVPKLIEVAKTQRNPEVRKQAFFWLGQSQDPRALAFFEQVLTR